MASLSQTIADLEAHFKSVVSTGEQFLADHIPHLAQVAQRIESSPVLAAAEAVAGFIDPQAEVILAKFITDFANLVPPAAAPAAPGPEPAPPA